MKKSVLVPSDSRMPPAAGGETLGEASNLFGAAASPEVAIRALEEGLILNAFARVHTEHNINGVVRDGHGVGGAGGSKGRFDAGTLLRRGTASAATAAGTGAGLVGQGHNSWWYHNWRGRKSRRCQNSRRGHNGMRGGWFHSGYTQNWCSRVFGAMAARAAGNCCPLGGNGP
jgi:hypothetical protein